MAFSTCSVNIGGVLLHHRRTAVGTQTRCCLVTGTSVKFLGGWATSTAMQKKCYCDFLQVTVLTILTYHCHMGYFHLHSEEGGQIRGSRVRLHQMFHPKH